MVGSHDAQHENLSSGQHAPHPVRHESPGTVQSQSFGVVRLIGISRRKAVVYVAILERRFVSSHMSLVILKFLVSSTLFCRLLISKVFNVSVSGPKEVC